MTKKKKKKKKKNVLTSTFTFTYLRPLRSVSNVENTFQVSGKVASQTSMGYVIDDPTKPQDVLQKSFSMKDLISIVKGNGRQDVAQSSL